MTEALRNEDTGQGSLPLGLDAEARLVRRARGRDPEAWAEIYERNHDRLYRYVLARVGDRDTADDLTANVFVEALKSIDGYASRGRPLLAWLYTIARNVVSYHHRVQFRRKAGQQALTAFSRLIGVARSPDPAAGTAGDPAAKVENWDLYRALSRLSGEQREVLLLRYFVGLTTPEVATFLGKRERAVYSLQARGIKALRRHLDPRP